jgi:tRNA modification GTPase
MSTRISTGSRVVPGVAVIRISGDRADAVLERLAPNLPEPRRMSVRALRDATGRRLDECLAVRFLAGESFTGENVVELHLHGGRAVVSAVLRAVEATGLSRAARAGEFTRRALANARLDLMQVQGLGDLIDADTELQRRAAMDVYGGRFSAFIESCRGNLLEALAFVEATIDFADEDVPVDVSGDVLRRIDGTRRAISAQLAGAGTARRLREGFEVALVGPPNAGKSSLLNAIARSDVAIVSATPGTTRDPVEIRVDIEGLPVTIVDTAGLRATEDEIEGIGIGRSLGRAERADMIVALLDPGDPDRDLLGVMPDLCVRTKRDLHGSWGISANDGTGVEDLLRLIGDRLGDAVAKAGFGMVEREEALLRDVARLLDDIAEGYETMEAEIVAEDLRRATVRLLDLFGGVDVEDVLDHVFRSFCIGK